MEREEGSFRSVPSVTLTRLPLVSTLRRHVCHLALYKSGAMPGTRVSLESLPPEVSIACVI